MQKLSPFIQNDNEWTEEHWVDMFQHQCVLFSVQEFTGIPDVCGHPFDLTSILKRTHLRSSIEAMIL